MLHNDRMLHRVTYDASFERRSLFLIDQFEELFTLYQTETTRQAFIDNLLYAAGISGGP